MLLNFLHIIGYLKGTTELEKTMFFILLLIKCIVDNFPYQNDDFPLPNSFQSLIPLIMAEMQGLTLQQLADLYDASIPEIRKLVYCYFWEWWNKKPE